MKRHSLNDCKTSKNGSGGRLALAVALAVVAPVVEVERNVHGNDEEQGDVHPYHPVAVVEELVDDSEDVPQLDEHHEHDALPLRALRAQGLRDRERP